MNFQDLAENHSTEIPFIFHVICYSLEDIYSFGISLFLYSKLHVSNLQFLLHPGFDEIVTISEDFRLQED